jgi:hypothetical protein
MVRFLNRLTPIVAVLIVGPAIVVSGPTASAGQLHRTPAESAPASAQVAPISAPGDTTEIARLSSTIQDGWRFDYYRNHAYECSISGYQTFTVATRVGSAPDARKPLWVYLHGGGVGYFDHTGTPQPNTANMTEEAAEDQRTKLQTGALTQLVAGSAAGFRLLAVSMCNRDIYGGAGLPDPNNPFTTPDGHVRTTNGLFATKAAVQFARTTFPTNDYFLYGTSAGSFGSYHVAWGLQLQGLPPTGIVADSGLLNGNWLRTKIDDEQCGQTTEAAAIIPRRLHPDVTAAGNDPDQLVATSRLTVPVLDVWTINDRGQCGVQPMSCPLRDGSTPRMGSVDCLHEPLRMAIAAEGSVGRSKTMRLCVDNPGTPEDCDRHTPTQFDGAINTLPGQPAEFNKPIAQWVALRLQD